MRLDIILDWKTHNYQKIILLNLKMFFICLMTYFFAITKDIVLLKIYFQNKMQ